jgi:hypothetical protein
VDGVTDPDTEPLGVLDTHAMYGGSGMPTTVPHQQNALVGEEEAVADGEAAAAPRRPPPRSPALASHSAGNSARRRAQPRGMALPPPAGSSTLPPRARALQTARQPRERDVGTHAHGG